MPSSAVIECASGRTSRSPPRSQPGKEGGDGGADGSLPATGDGAARALPLALLAASCLGAAAGREGKPTDRETQLPRAARKAG